jgi:hypothetical protein
MCFVLDINSFHHMFDQKTVGHADFAPLLNWLQRGSGTSLVIGGTHYRAELRRMDKYLPILGELKRGRKLSEVANEIVDENEKSIRAAVPRKKFDDPHIVALFCASGCLIFASHDKRADEFIKLRRLYPKGQRPPSIYRSEKYGKRLLRPENIVQLRNVGP